jgi:hypothetical protein
MLLRLLFLLIILVPVEDAEQTLVLLLLRTFPTVNRGPLLRLSVSGRDGLRLSSNGSVLSWMSARNRSNVAGTAAFVIAVVEQTVVLLVPLLRVRRRDSRGLRL